MKNTIYAIMLLLLLATASAATLDVKALDQHNANLPGVKIAPEWKTNIFGWNDFIPQFKTTGADGLTGTWFVTRSVTVQVNSATLEGYTCTRGEETRIVTTNGANHLVTHCTPDEDHSVPEFGPIAGLLTVGIAVAGIFLLRKQ